MRYLGFSEQAVLYELPLARGLQYQHAILSMEGAEVSYIAEPEEIEASLAAFENILSQPFDDSEDI